MVQTKSFLTIFLNELGNVKVGDDSMVDSLGYGDFIGYHTNKYGKQIEVHLKHVLLVPFLWVNLCSITKATSYVGCKDICEDNLITVQTNTDDIHFSTVLKHGQGKIMATDLLTDTECANQMIEKSTSTELHQLMGHPHQQKVFDTAKMYGITLKNDSKDQVCENCAKAKIRVKNFGHSSEEEMVSKIGERIALYISSIPHISFGGAKFWLDIQEYYTNYCWSLFLNSKSEVSTVFTKWAYQFKQKHGLDIKHVI
jgi:hypothetical protein